MRALENLPSALWSQHSEHRLIFSRPIFWADILWFGGRNVFTLAANVVLAASLCAAIVWIALSESAASPWRALAIGGLALSACFSWIQEENWTSGFQNALFAIYLFALLAFQALQRGYGESGKRPLLNLALSIVFAILSTFSLANGLLVAPILIVQSFYLKAPPLPKIALSLATAVIAMAYFWDYETPGAHARLLESLTQHPVSVARFALVFLGAPAYHLKAGLQSAEVLGLLLVVLALSVLALAVSDRTRRKSTPLLALVVLIGGSAVLAGAGRINFGVESAIGSRYALAPLLFILGLFLYLQANVASSKVRSLLPAAGLLLCLLLLPGQRGALRVPSSVLFEHKLGGLALREGVYDARFTGTLFPAPDLLFRIARDARAQGLSLFDPGNTDYERHPPTVSPTRTCDGHIDTIGDTAIPGAHVVTGWIYDGERSQVPQALAITEGTRTIGTAIAGLRRDDVAGALHVKEKYTGWIGFFKGDAVVVQAAGKTSAGDYCLIEASR